MVCIAEHSGAALDGECRQLHSCPGQKAVGHPGAIESAVERNVGLEFFQVEQVPRISVGLKAEHLRHLGAQTVYHKILHGAVGIDIEIKRAPRRYSQCEFLERGHKRLDVGKTETAVGLYRHWRARPKRHCRERKARIGPDCREESLYTDVAEGQTDRVHTYQTPSLHYLQTAALQGRETRERKTHDTPLVVEVPHTYGDAGHGYIGRIESRGGTGTFYGVESRDALERYTVTHYTHRRAGRWFRRRFGMRLYPFFVRGEIPECAVAHVSPPPFHEILAQVHGSVGNFHIAHVDSESVDHGKHRHAEIEVFYLQVLGFDQERCGGGRVD